MKASEIRQRFLDFFEVRGHEVRPSAALVPTDDPTLLFTNAGMVPFKRVFLGLEEVPYKRAVTSQKCVRAGGKHNDLEEVGRTARHHTFFEMLGNFSFGDYFKRDAIRFAWDFLTEELGLDPSRLYVTVHHTDDEAADLWVEEARVDPARVFRLGDKDNFWQMADTGPCGPCSELHYDLQPEKRAGGEPLSSEEFEVGSETGEFLELWNLVFMQFDRDAEGVMHPLPAPSIDTGAGLERLAAVLQGVDSNYHTDLFLPLLDKVGEVVGRPYDADSQPGVSYRVLADHARAVVFLLADGVFPSNEGRGYVLRRILRRAVRHAWLLGRRTPSLVEVVGAVIGQMSDVYPQLAEREDHLLKTTQGEEERFLATIEGGMERFDEFAPWEGSGEISGQDAFRLYDTFGFPIDLTRLMAEERGYSVDVEGFEAALQVQRERSRADRAQADLQVDGGELTEGWIVFDPDGDQEWVGYETTEVETRVLEAWQKNGRWGLKLEKNPFYARGGGQVSDSGVVSGDGWKLEVDEVHKIGERLAVVGAAPDLPLEDTVSILTPVRASVAPEVRHDTERNHTATHLLHAALRETLGEHVVQKGSLVVPDRLRFDFAHTAPVTKDELGRIEAQVNRAIWNDSEVTWEVLPYDEAVDRGAMALFGEKYGDEVRMVSIPGLSKELCGGTHVRHTGEIGLFRIVSESGVAAGVRRIEALTGPGAFQYMRSGEDDVAELAASLKTTPDNLSQRIRQLLDEKSELEGLVDELRRSGGSGESAVSEGELACGSETVSFRAVRLTALDPGDVRDWGDRFINETKSGIALAGAGLPGDKWTVFAFVTDDLIQRGIRADEVVRKVTEEFDGRGGGRPHMAQAGVASDVQLDEALAGSEAIVQSLLTEVD